MFSVTDEWEEEETATSSTSSNNRNQQTTTTNSHASSLSISGTSKLVSGFHKPGDAEFSAVAIPPKHLIERSKNLLEKKAQQQQQQETDSSSTTNYSGNDVHAIGDSTWASSQCRCLRCELLRASSSWTQQQENQKSSSSNNSTQSLSAPCTLILLDADNYAFPAFSKKPASQVLSRYLLQNSSKNEQQQQQEQEQKKVFVWAFYGACFSKAFHNVDLEQFVTRNNNDNQNKKNENTWDLLQRYNSVHCTKCAGSSQAADLVCEAVASLIADEDQVRCVLLTGDKGLRESVKEIWSSVRSNNQQQQQTENSSSSSSSSFAVPDCQRDWTSDQIWKCVLFDSFPSSASSSNNNNNNNNFSSNNNNNKRNNNNNNSHHHQSKTVVTQQQQQQPQGKKKIGFGSQRFEAQRRQRE